MRLANQERGLQGEICEVTWRQIKHYELGVTMYSQHE